MPSAKGYKRDYKQENKTAKRRKETGAGSKSGDATRHRARRKVAKTAKVAGKDVDHRKSLKSGGTNAKSNLRTRSRKANRSAGGKIGSRRGKAAGARKAHRSR
jgi:hypothetical protein